MVTTKATERTFNHITEATPMASNMITIVINHINLLTIIVMGSIILTNGILLAMLLNQITITA
jgi:hypothetical protein